LRIARVYARAHDFFGTQHRASAWLKKPALALGEHTPLSMLDTELGAGGVMTLIYQLEENDGVALLFRASSSHKSATPS
jgi:putative toxin-antitoxin system antitoxin component (TIGR02293 family)